MILNYRKKNKKLSSGFALLTAVITTAILLLISFAVVNLAVKEIILSYAGQESQFSFYNADNGVECAMYWDLRNNGTMSAFDGSAGTTILCNGTSISTNSQIVPTVPPQNSVIGSDVGNNIQNQALNKSTRQSSTMGGGSSDKAVDGNTNGDFSAGSVTMTNYGFSPGYQWWQVDLGSSYKISSIKIWNRTDSLTYGLANFWVFVSNSPFGDSDTPTDLQNKAGVWSYHYNPGSAPNPSFNLPVPNYLGRYVRVQLGAQNYLNLAEVEVMGKSSNITPSVFSVPYTHGCAIVWVTKTSTSTTITSRGYNTCDTSSPRRYERGITTTY